MDRLNPEMYSCKAEMFEAADDLPTNPNLGETLGDVIARRLSRRQMLRGSLATAVVTAALPAGLAASRQAAAVDETHHVAPGHRAHVLIRWGDPVEAGAPPFDPLSQTAEAQAKQFGYNNDYIGFAPLPIGSDNPAHGLLCVNHEYTNEEVMFPGLGRQDRDAEFAGMTPELIAIEMAAHGGSIIEISKENGVWRTVPESPFNRRITASTPMTISGPAAGHDRLKTSADPTGRKVLGTINNCAGGMTPWGTYLMAEENFHGYFRGELPEGHAEAKNHERHGLPGGWYAWNEVDERFDVGKEPNEPNRFGWVVEVDPYDRSSVPAKRTALGRFRHEGAETVVNPDGRIVIYSGDDNRFDYLYKFVSEGALQPGNREANRDLLDSGTLYVAKFDEDKVEWLPLIFGQGPLTPENGFASQADVLIDTRLAADTLGATPMDRPEDVQPNAATGKVYVMLTNNTKRKPGEENAANPRAENAFGHIVEISPPHGDHAASVADWSMLVMCGDPRVAEVGALWHPETSEHGWFAAPDNAAVDSRGRLWVSTDQGSGWAKTGKADGVYGVETEGERRGLSKMFFRVPVGAEMCGPLFTKDGSTLFVAVQHPATDGAKAYPGFERASTFEDPATRWPDFQEGMPPRPSVLFIVREDGGPIGG